MKEKPHFLSWILKMKIEILEDRKNTIQLLCREKENERKEEARELRNLIACRNCIKYFFNMYCVVRSLQKVLPEMCCISSASASVLTFAILTWIRLELAIFARVTWNRNRKTRISKRKKNVQSNIVMYSLLKMCDVLL